MIGLSSSAQLTPQFSASATEGCAPVVISFTDASTGGAVAWRWDLGNGTISFLRNPAVTYFNPGTYSVKLVVTNAAGVKDSITKTNYITVRASPNVNFTANILTGCFPLPVQFTNSSTPGSGSISSVLWDFGDGGNSTATNPVHTYTSGGTYNVSLKITNSSGCVKTFARQNYIAINQGVRALFSASNSSGCTAPETITFTNLSVGTGLINYNWLFGDGTTSSAFQPSHTYTTPGSYTVKLIASSSNGCRDTFTLPNPINIGLVNANFTGPTVVCAGNAVAFTNTSAPTPISVLWTFGDGTNSTTISPTKTFTNAGSYNVKLVSNFGGCRDSITKTVTVLAGGGTSFTGNPRAACSVPLTVNFANTSVSPGNSLWLFGDGASATTSNPTHVYTTPGSFTVTLINTNASGCKDTLVIPNYIIAAPLDVVFSNLPDSGCAPFTKSFSAAANTNEPIASYLWDFGDGTTSTLANPGHTFPVGTYNIQLTIVTISGCSATKTLASAIKVGTNPTVNFSATPRIACAKKMIDFQDLSTGGVTSWLWSFGDGGSSTSQNPRYLYSDTGKFTVQLVVNNNGCKDSIAFGDYIQILPPIAKFLVPLDCNSRFTKAFIDSSIGADQWRWNFGDGDTSILQNPTHTYQNAGTYTVSLTVINLVTGCDHTKTTTLIISNERAAFNVNNSIVCRNVPNAVTVTSTNDSSKVTLYEWNFGDGAIAVGNPITHTYSNAGTYNIRLVITDANGCRDSLVKQNVVKVLGPSANFAAVAPVICITDTARFTDQTTTDSLYRINLWTFDFGDGSTKSFSAAPFTHLYNTGGIFSIKLTVKDNFGCLDSIVKANVITVGNPKVNFVAADSMSCPGRPIAFSDSSSGLGLRYNWLFGDGNNSTVASPSHAYADTGTYSVSLTITDAAGCVQTKTRPRYIKIVRPRANFTVSDTLSTCPPLIVQFTNTSTDTRSLVWDFGDGNTSQSVNPSHFYNVSGTFIASLTATSAGGCTSVKTQRIVVRGPQGSFSYGPITGCNPLTVTFTASTQDQTSFIWDFNDGTTVPTTAPVVTHIFNRLGSYLPKMILRDVAGCTVAIEGTDTIIVNGVDAEFMPETTVRCSPGAVQFNNLSTSTEPITGYLWNFGDGITSTEASPLHNYATLGNFIPTLTATSQSGCIDLATLTVPLRVVKTPEISITQTADGCVPITKTFNGNLLNADTAAIVWKWVLNNRDTSTGIRLVTPVITNAGQYTATLFAQNSSGCKDTASVNYETFAIPNIAAGTDAFICLGGSLTLTATGGDTYLWSPASTLSCATCATTIATPTATTPYVVAGTNAKGCTSRDTVMVNVQATIVISSGFADTLCTGSFITLNVTGANNYTWSPATGLNTTTGGTVRANPTQNIIYMVVGRDDKGCFSDTAYFPISVFPIPTVQLRSDTTITLGESITLTPKFSTDVINVTWFPLIAVVANNYPSITVQPTSATQYVATVRNIAGCLSSEPVNINVKCSDANAFIPNTFSPNNDGVNDIFYPRGTGLYNVKSTKIFNRWGEVVFTKLNYSANDASAGWDGSFRGRQLLPDVYIYIIEIVCQNNTVLLYKGNITLIR